MTEGSPTSRAAGAAGDVVLHVRVEGEVQGVGYRRFVQREADALGLAGWVRNLPDGAVEVMASGDAAAVERLHRRLETGPAHARVSRVVALPAQHREPTVERPFRVHSTAPRGEE